MEEIEEIEELNAPELECPACDGTDPTYLGQLGRRLHFRCRACGIDFSHDEKTQVR